MTDSRKRTNGDAAALDVQHIWHPYTQVETAAAPIEIVAGKGAWLRAADGREFLDLISSWWVNVHGHAHPAIAQAISRQASALEHVIFADFTHKPAAELSARLCALAPEDISRVFFSDNGSTAVEVALKIAVQYWRNRGKPERKGFLSFTGGYHGDTVGAMSVGAQSGFFAPFSDLMFKADFLPFPDTWDGDNEATEKERAALEALNAHLDNREAETAAIIVEPLIQGAGGMRMCRPEFLSELVDAARARGVLVIFDEVMTGFGRTGELFASTTAGVSPDMMCLSKGLTGGFLPMGATLCREDIFDAFRGDGFGKAFAHGHSYTANPLGCAAALASLDLFESGAWRVRAKTINAKHRAFLDGIAGHRRVRRPRLTGTVAAFDVAVSDSGYQAAIGAKLKEEFLDRGMLLRPLGNVVYLMPPYCIEDADLDRAYGAVCDVLDLVN